MTAAVTVAAADELWQLFTQATVMNTLSVAVVVGTCVSSDKYVTDVDISIAI